MDDQTQRGQVPPAPATDRIVARHEGAVVASASVESSPEPHGTAKVSLERHRDDAPEAVRGDLVDQVLDLPGVRNSDSVHVVLPLGDAASIARLQERTIDSTAHAAGSSSIVDADLPPAAGESAG